MGRNTGEAGPQFHPNPFQQRQRSHHFQQQYRGGNSNSNSYVGCRYWSQRLSHLSVATLYVPKSRQSAKPFLQSSELGLPQPLTRRRVWPPPPFGSEGKGHTRWRERGWGRDPIQTRRGHTLWYSLYGMYFVYPTNSFLFLLHFIRYLGAMSINQ